MRSRYILLHREEGERRKREGKKGRREGERGGRAGERRGREGKRGREQLLVMEQLAGSPASTKEAELIAQ